MAASANAGCLDFLLRPQQQDIKQWLLEHNKPISVIHAARGYGKTWMSLILALEAGLKTPKARIVYACPTREEARQIAVPTMLLIQEQLGEALEIKRGYAAHEFKLKNGSIIVLEGADDDRGNHLRGPFAHLVICDEAAFWRHCDYVVHSVLFPQVHRVGGRIIIISTSPESVGHEFVGICETAKKNGSYLRRTIDDNKHLSEKEKTDLINELGGNSSTAARRELWCEFVIESSRAVIPEFDESRHVIKEFDRIPIWRDRYVFIDLGFKDFTHSLFGFWNFQEASLYIEDEIAETYGRTEKTVEAIKEKEKELWGEHKPHMRIADNDLQIIADMGQLGLPVSPTMKSDKEAHINSLRTMFAQDKVKIHKRCQVLIHQLKVGIWNKQRTDYERLPGAGHLDGVDALVYGNRMLDRSRNPMPIDHGYATHTHWVPPIHRQSQKNNLLAIVGKK
jgi:hypothetical protein